MSPSQAVEVEVPAPSFKLDLSIKCPRQPNATTRRSRARELLAAAQRMATAHTMVLITPLLVLGGLLAAGIMGVLILSDATQQQRQDDAVNEAVARGIIITEKMQMAAIPANGLASYVLKTPDYHWPTVEQGFNSSAQALLDLLRISNLEFNMLAISPAGIVSAILPLQINIASMHHDLLADSFQRDISLNSIRTRKLSLTGPYLFKGGFLGLVIRLPVFVNGATYGPNSTFGVPPSPIKPYGNTPYDCPECYGELRFWGFTSSFCNWEDIRRSSRVDDLYTKSGYLFQLSRPPLGTETGDFVMASSPGIENQTLADAVQVRFRVLDNVWTLTLSHREMWCPSWRSPMLVVVVIASLVVSLLIGLVMGWNCRLEETTCRLGVTAGKLHEEKERLDALLVRQFELIHCFANEHAAGNSSSALLGVKINLLRHSLDSERHKISSPMRSLEGDRIELHEQLGSGNFGKVYRGSWRGTTVAVKCIVLPSSMSRSAHAERMALMEAALSSSMHHPHLVQTYTYSIKSMKDSSLMEDTVLLLGPASFSEADAAAGVPCSPGSGGAAAGGSQSLDVPGLECTQDVHSFEIQLVLEFCDAGSLDECLKRNGFFADNGLNFGGILDTAADVAKGMLHLHMNEILHSDLKAGNVMFKTGGHDGRGVIAKVVDFGLSIQLDVSGMQTHVSKMFQGTLTHMAPEVLLVGKQSKAADVYAFGILLFELYTGASPYLGIPSALLGHHVAHEGCRPQFTSFTPKGYRELAERCWQADPDMRPSFTQILEELQSMRSAHPRSRPISLPSRPAPPYSPLRASVARKCEPPMRRSQVDSKPRTPLQAAGTPSPSSLDAAAGEGPQSTLTPPDSRRRRSAMAQPEQPRSSSLRPIPEDSGLPGPGGELPGGTESSSQQLDLTPTDE